MGRPGAIGLELDEFLIPAFYVDQFAVQVLM